MEEMKITDIFKISAEKNASDIHLQTGSKPSLRIKGEIVRLEEYPEIDDTLMMRVIQEFLKDILQHVLYHTHLEAT